MGAIFIESAFPEMVSEKLHLSLAKLQAYGKLCSLLLTCKNQMAEISKAHPCLSWLLMLNGLGTHCHPSASEHSWRRETRFPQL